MRSVRAQRSTAFSQHSSQQRDICVEKNDFVALRVRCEWQYRQYISLAPLTPQCHGNILSHTLCTLVKMTVTTTTTTHTHTKRNARRKKCCALDGESNFSLRVYFQISLSLRSMSRLRRRRRTCTNLDRLLL